MSIILALLIDRWCGEPPARIHPVVWMGSYLKHAGRGLPNHGPRMALFLGTIYWLAGAALVLTLFRGREPQGDVVPAAWPNSGTVPTRSD